MYTGGQGKGKATVPQLFVVASVLLFILAYYLWRQMGGLEAYERSVEESQAQAEIQKIESYNIHVYNPLSAEDTARVNALIAPRIGF